MIAEAAISRATPRIFLIWFCRSSPEPRDLSTSTPTNAGSATGKTLVMESSPESTITQSFNPFVPTGAPWGMGATGLIYEPLIQFNLAAPPKYYPWLATKYAWSNGGKTLTFTIRQGVQRWRDHQLDEGTDRNQNADLCASETY